MQNKPNHIITPEELNTFLRKEELKRRVGRVHISTAPRLSLPPVMVRIPTDTTDEEGKPVSPAEFRRRTKASRKKSRKAPEPAMVGENPT
jgi:hypothetical protein